MSVRWAASRSGSVSTSPTTQEAMSHSRVREVRRRKLGVDPGGDLDQQADVREGSPPA